MARKKFGDPLSAGTRTAGTVQGSNGRKGTTRTTTDVLDPDTLRDLLGNKKEIYSFGAGVLGQNNDMSYENQLMSLLTQLNDIGGQISPEMQKQIYEMLLTLYQAREQRAHDENALKEQRLYDSPMSQMLRLMSTGMSRDAALQALAGGSDPALVGSGADAQAPQAYGPTDIRAQQLQVAQAVFNGISTLSGLVSMGFSIPQSIQQTRFLENQNVLTTAQKNAFQSAQEASQILYNAGSAAETFANVASAASEIQRLAKGGDATAQNFIDTGGITRLQQNAPFASKFLADTAMTDRQYSDHATSFQQNLDVQEAQKELMGAQKNNFIQQTSNLTEEFKLIQANTNYVNEQKALAAAMGIKTAAETDYINSQRDSIDMQNELTRATYDAEVEGKKGLEILSVSRLQQAYEIINRFAAAKTFDLWKLEAESLSKNYEMMTTLHALEKMYYDGASDMYKDNSAFFDMCNSFRLSGGFTYIDMLIEKGKVSNSVDLGPFKFGYTGTTNTTDLQFYGLTRGKEFMQWFNTKYGEEGK